MRVTAQWDATAKQRQLLEVLNSPDIRRNINQIVAENAEDFVPYLTGALVKSVDPRADGIYYHAPYAKYQFYGNVYGPNIFNPKSGTWFSRKPKYPTGRKMGDGTDIVDRKGQVIYTRHYTTDGTGWNWINLMWLDRRREVQNEITRMLKEFL